MDELNIDLSLNADDDFFGSLKGNKSSKLQQLFVDDSLSTDDKEQSLKYQRPKDIAITSSATSITLIAKVVSVYKQGEFQGKVGLALVQNTDDTYNIIIYKTKTHILASLKLQPRKYLLYRQKNYWQFYDESFTYWSFSFDNNTDEKEFVEKLDAKSIGFKENSDNDDASENQQLCPSLNNEACSIERLDFKSKTTMKETKSSLIKRMAKMDKPLPTLSSNNQQTTTECSDSSDTEVIHTPLASSQKPLITPRSNKLTGNKSNQQLVTSVVGLNSVANSIFPINPLESQYMQMLLTEQRTQGSEIRMNINKIENKIEKVLDKLELYDRNDGKQKVEKDDEILELEEKLLRLKKENRKLKQDLQQNYSDQTKGKQMQEILCEFEETFKKINIDYKQGLKGVLLQLSENLEEKSEAVQEMQNSMKDIKLKQEVVVSELEMNIRKNRELEKEICLLNQKENELKNKLNEKEAEAIKQKHECLELQNKLLEKNQTTLRTPNDALIKSIMNNLFVDISDKLNNSNVEHSEQILSLIATSIKQQTLKSLQQSLPKDDSN